MKKRKARRGPTAMKCPVFEYEQHLYPAFCGTLFSYERKRDLLKAYDARRAEAGRWKR